MNIFNTLFFKKRKRKRKVSGVLLRLDAKVLGPDPPVEKPSSV